MLTEEQRIKNCWHCDFSNDYGVCLFFNEHVENPECYKIATVKHNSFIYTENGTIILLKEANVPSEIYN